MKDAILSSARRIGDPRVAACFSDPLRRRLVLHLARGELSLTELARVTGLELKNLHYHVTALRKLGLLVVTRERRRAGRAVKMYRARASAFFVPESVMPSGSTAALTQQLRRSLDSGRDRSQDGVLYHLGDDGEPRMRPVKTAPARQGDAAEYWQVLKLSRTEALRLAKDIGDCLKRYAGRHGVARDAYLVHFAFAPRESGAARRSRQPGRQPGTSSVEGAGRTQSDGLGAAPMVPQP
jgi:DNA-binding transcriptional ArsR family regulator